MNSTENREMIRSRLIMMFSKFSNIVPDKISTDSTLRSELGIDSVDYLDLLFYVEKEFSISLQDVNLKKISTVGDLENEIANRISKVK